LRKTADVVILDEKLKVSAAAREKAMESLKETDAPETNAPPAVKATDKAK